jgi:hypothetical protein
MAQTDEVVAVHTCVECGEVITNPVSEERIALQFRAWLAETDPALEESFSESYLPRSIMGNPDEHTRCIVTGEPMDLCTFCAAAECVEWLHRQTVTPEVVWWAMDLFLARPDKGYAAKRLPTRVKITLAPSKKPVGESAC